MKRNSHNLSHYRLATFDMGKLVPVGLAEVLPGDTFRHSTSLLMRVSTLVAPVMHPVSVRIHHWYFPHRLGWEILKENAEVSDTWEEFIQGLGSDTLNVYDMSTATTRAEGDLWDHLGVHPDVNAGMINPLPLIMYNVIFNNFYRDEQITAARVAYADTLANIAWEKDYFTTCRTDPQFGTAISIPLTGTLPVLGLGRGANATPTASATYQDSSATNITGPAYHGVDSGEVFMRAASTSQNATPVVNVDLSEGGININELRTAFALQRFLENRNRYGSRYRDYLRYLGIRPTDGRLFDAEYLGGGKQNISFSEVLATAEGTSTEVGDMAGHGITALRTRPYTRFFEEGGYVMSLASVRPKTIYQEHMPRHWLRSTHQDFWQKEYEAFGPQAVLDKEVYADHANTTDIFGYQDRHRDYREIQSSVHGTFRSTYEDWHLARQFGATPALNNTFIACDPSNRIFADLEGEHLKAQAYHRIRARRLVSKTPRVA